MRSATWVAVAVALRGEKRRGEVDDSERGEDMMMGEVGVIEARSANCLSPGAGKWERAGVNLDLAKFSISTLGGRVTSCG